MWDFGNRKSYRLPVGKPEGKKPPGRPKRGREYVKMYLKEGVCENMGWIHLAQDMDHCEHRNDPLSFIKCGKFLDQLNDY